MPDPSETQIQAWADEAERGYDLGFQEVLVKRLDQTAAIIPTKGTDGAAGFDLYTTEGGTVYVDSTRAFATGIAIAIPEGFCGLVLPRSGLACKRGLTIANSPGLIDCDYRGEVMVFLHNESPNPQTIEVGDRVAQLLIVAVPTFRMHETVLDLPETGRGLGGFGSTGT